MIDGLSSEFLSRYDIVKELGKGAFGLVVEARQLSLSRSVAIKFLHGEKGSPILNEQRFLREAKILNSLTHGNIVEVYDFGYDGTVPYIVTELLNGRPLDEILEERKKIPWTEAIALASQIAGGLAAAHDKGVLHRDMKSANVFIVEDNIVKLLDFGLAKREGVDATLTRSRQIVGTPMYAAPEQLRGEQLSPASDLYSLGIILYRMIAGVHPFPQGWFQLVSAKLDNPAKPLRLYCDEKEAPEALCNLVDSLLDRDVKKRPQNAVSVLKRLRAIREPRAKVQKTRVKGKPMRLLLPLAIVIGFIGLWSVWSVYEKSRISFSEISIRPQVKGARLSWTTSQVRETRLQYRKPNGQWQEVGEGTSRRHEVLLDDLQPGTRYEIRAVGAEDKVLSFETLEPFELSKFAVSDAKATRLTLSVAVTSPCSASIEVFSPSASKGILHNKHALSTGTRSIEVVGLSPKTSYRVSLDLVKGGRSLHRELTCQTEAIGSTVLWAPVLGQATALTPDISSVYMGSFLPRAARRPFNDALVVCLGKTGLHCVDLKKGKVRWSQKKEGLIMAIDQWAGRAFTMNRQGLICSWSIKSGERQWKHDTKGLASWRTHGLASRDSFFAGPYGLFYWLKGKGVVCLEGDSGIIRWQLNDKNYYLSYWTVDGEYTWVYRRRSAYEAFQLATGKRVPRLDIKNGNTLSTQPVIGHGRLFVGRRDGWLSCRNLAGEAVFNTKLDGNVSKIAVGEGKVFVAIGRPSKLCALSVPEGKMLWQLDLEKPVFSFLYIHRGNIYFEDTRDTIVCCATWGPQLLWKRNSHSMSGFGLVPFDEGLIYCSDTIDVIALRD